MSQSINHQGRPRAHTLEQFTPIHTFVPRHPATLSNLQRHIKHSDLNSFRVNGRHGPHNNNNSEYTNRLRNPPKTQTRHWIWNPKDMVRDAFVVVMVFISTGSHTCHVPCGIFVGNQIFRGCRPLCSDRFLYSLFLWGSLLLSLELSQSKERVDQ